jgi:uncharacterized membrane protein
MKRISPWSPRRTARKEGSSFSLRRAGVASALGGLAAVAALAGPAFASPSHAAAPTAQYKLVLGPVNSQYVGINNNGDIIGIGVDSAAFGREEGFLLPAGTTTPEFLGSPGDETDQSTDNQPQSINDKGVIVGNYGKNEVLPGGGEATIPRPVIWNDNTTGTDLGVNPSGDADAFGINNNSIPQIVGTQAGSTVTPWVLQGTTVTNLPTFQGSTTTEARAINGNGVVVGDAQKSGSEAATEWVNGQVSSLGMLNGGSFSEALAVNSSGVAVGAATAPGDPVNLFRAVMFSNGKAIDLNVPGEGVQNAAHATAINDNGVIVGDDGVQPGLALVGVGNGFIFQNGKATELNTLVALPSNVRLAGARGINNAGDIVGIADVTQSDGSQVSEGYELVPTT